MTSPSNPHNACRVPWRVYAPSRSVIGGCANGTAHGPVVNDNPEFLELVRDILKDEHYATAIDGDLEGALDRIVDSRPDVLILDLRLGTDELHGWDIAQELRREPALEGLPVIICSADVLRFKLADDLDNTKQVRTLPKPFAIAELTAAIDGLLAEAKASPESVGRNSRRAASSIMTSSASPSMSASSSFGSPLHGHGTEASQHSRGVATPRDTGPQSGGSSL